MALFTDSPYEHDIYSVKQFGEHTVRITCCSTVRQSGWEAEKEHKGKCSVNDSKLADNLTRARNKVREYVLCNPWDYWCTFTIDPEKFDRHDLDGFMKSFAKFLNNYNSRNCRDCPEYRVRYVLVPEQHKDGAWHVHGFIRGIVPSDLYTNRYGYLTWMQYEQKFGFISMDRIKDIDKCSSYILKYMTKDSDKNVTALNRHLYYASKGLEKAVELYRGHADYKGGWDWEHPEGYIRIKTLDTRKDDINDYMEVTQG